MIRRFFLLALICASSICSFSQAVDTLTASKCFIEAPMSVLPLISKNTRLDMIDYFNANSDRASENEYGGECLITAISDKAISFEATRNVDCQIFVLNEKSSQPLIGIIHTIPTPIPDSYLTIYSKVWEKKNKAFSPPKLADWLTPEGKKQRSKVEEALPFIMAKYTFDPSTNSLIISQQMKNYFIKGDGSDILSLLKDELRYKWNGKQFKLVK